MRKTRRIALVHYSYPPVIGGVEKIVFDHAQYFSRLDFETHVFAGDGQNNNPNIQFHLIPEFQSLNNTNPALLEQILTQPTFPEESENLTKNIYKKMEEAFRDVDIFFIHNVLTNSLNPCLNMAFVRYIQHNPSKIFVSWVHDIALDSMRNVYSYPNPHLTELIYQPRQEIHHVGISAFLKKTLVREMGLTPSSITVIPNGIDLTALLNLHPTSARIFSRYKMGQKDPFVFLPIKIMRHKNVELCLHVLAVLKKLKKKPVMVISASGFPHGSTGLYVKEVQETILKLGLKDDVIFLHNEVEEKYKTIEYKIVDDFYRLSDIVLLLSSFENFGLPLLESAITKTPILVNDLEVFREIEVEHMYYTNIEHESSEQIAQKVIDITEKNPNIVFFRKVKREFNFDTIFQTKIIPFIEHISVNPRS